MTCRHIGGAIVCTRGRKSKRCHACDQPHTRLCDWPDENRRSGTCDRPMCDQHAHQIDAETDYCRQHFEEREANKAKLNPRAAWPFPEAKK